MTLSKGSPDVSVVRVSWISCVSPTPATCPDPSREVERGRAFSIERRFSLPCFPSCGQVPSRIVWKRERLTLPATLKRSDHHGLGGTPMARIAKESACDKPVVEITHLDTVIRGVRRGHSDQGRTHAPVRKIPGDYSRIGARESATRESVHGRPLALGVVHRLQGVAVLRRFTGGRAGGNTSQLRPLNRVASVASPGA